ncbi:MAG: AbrB/MazE/SpoVT family DNA-binding domain-containing protein [Thiobacillaceae bacterium]|nr:AbrB/MazE/SpoVT family DNA-binding domain-containing protein [Thiobacillaceae bacterium]MCX7672724.1 AbrB/MazE/SpoVT family DNA-binding domain-containing protein [Thiobacillaceae bacterium]MDW8324442.1 AbrB/MazE/SpoVT family DNA-binding domain-containing protein [Burkholderiales bacterium]
MHATLSSKGQVTLPARIRAALGLTAGDKLDFQLMGDGSIRVVPVTRDPLAISRVLPKPDRTPATAAEFDAAVAAGACARFVRGRS